MLTLLLVSAASLSAQIIALRKSDFVVKETLLDAASTKITYYVCIDGSCAAQITREPRLPFAQSSPLPPLPAGDASICTSYTGQPDTCVRTGDDVYIYNDDKHCLTAGDPGVPLGHCDATRFPKLLFRLPRSDTLIVALARDAWQSQPADVPLLSFFTVNLAQRARDTNDRALALHKAGDFATAATLFTQAFTLDPTYGQAAFNAACAYARANNPSSALARLRSAFSLDAARFKAKAQKDPDLDAVRANPKFVDLLKP